MHGLVEREAVLQELASLLRDAARHGRVALVAGEAGIGKTSVLRALAAGHPGTAVWWGACDALETPHPLAPLLDMARQGRARFGARLDGPRPALFQAVLAELGAADTPTLMVIEDLHWADDATLDLVKFLGRRIEGARALLVLSYRDDEIGAAHPLRRVIGDLPPAAMAHVALPRLTPAAVTALALRAERSPAGIYKATQGNPFFVTELLRHAGQEVPSTVQAVVLARYARLPAPAQAVLRLASVVPARVERWLVDALLAPALPDLEACLASGLLVADGATLAFRHELGRVAIETSLPAPTAQALHAQVLQALAAPGRDTPPARLVHHASRAADEAAVRRHAPSAAAEARRRGSHREAAAQYRAALQCGGIGAAERREWLEAWAVECQLTDQLGDAIAARQQLGDLLLRDGHLAAAAQNLSRLALVYVLALRNADAEAASHHAIGLLDGLPPSIERADAYWVQAQLRMLNRDCAASVAWAEKAIALAEPLGQRPIVAAAFGTMGAATMFLDVDAGVVHLQRALDLALADGLHWVAANSYINLGSAFGELYRFDAADRWLRDGIAFCTQHEIDFYLHYATSWLALAELHTGRWDDAAAHASEAAARAGPRTTSRVMALVALGRLRTRRGDPGAADALDTALALAEGTGTLQRIGPVRAARAEAAFQRGDAAAAAAEADAALDLALQRGHAWLAGELAFWRWRARGDAAPAGCAEPFALQIGGRWREAAAAWARLGCPYEEARALADGDAAAQQAALEIFDRLGAQPAADALRRRLRQAGVRGIARGARASTQSHPFGLTQRELDVLHLLCAGLRNAEIAERLSRSVRTVDHHVAAVLAKLNVDSRTGAADAARRAGLAAPSGWQFGQSATPK
jgi:ATP/maltotriose-dependent transcriptional regulator MalT